MVKNSPVNARDTGSVPGLGRSPRERNGNPFQYSCLHNPMDRGSWWATLHGVAQRVKHDSRDKTTSSFQSLVNLTDACFQIPPKFDFILKAGSTLLEMMLFSETAGRLSNPRETLRNLVQHFQDRNCPIFFTTCFQDNFSSFPRVYTGAEKIKSRMYHCIGLPGTPSVSQLFATF